MIKEVKTCKNGEVNDDCPISRSFREIGVYTFKEACDFVQGLAYGRISRADKPMLVLSERKGTCSSKHALLALLAREYHLPIRLMVGIYMMNEENTPGVGSVLDRFGLPSIPEAHCYLTRAGEHLDFTGIAGTHIDRFLLERSIEPERTHLEKISIHRDFLKSYYGHGKLEEIWTIREACIAALSER